MKRLVACVLLLVGALVAWAQEDVPAVVRRKPSEMPKVATSAGGFVKVVAADVPGDPMGFRLPILQFATRNLRELETIFKDVKSAELAKADCVGKPVFMVAADAGMFNSRGDARRMAQQGGLSLNGAKIDANRAFADADFVDGRVAVLRSGKKNHFLLRVH